MKDNSMDTITCFVVVKLEAILDNNIAYIQVKNRSFLLPHLFYPYPYPY